MYIPLLISSAIVTLNKLQNVFNCCQFNFINSTVLEATNNLKVTFLFFQQIEAMSVILFFEWILNGYDDTYGFTIYILFLFCWRQKISNVLMDSLQLCRYVIIYIYCFGLLKYISLVSLILPHWFIQVPYMNRIWHSSAIQFSYIEQWLPCYMVIARRNDLLATVYTVTFIKITRKLTIDQNTQIRCVQNKIQNLFNAKHQTS